VSAEMERIDFAVSFSDGNKVKIESAGCSLITEYFADKSAARKTMSPVSIFYSAFAL